MKKINENDDDIVKLKGAKNLFKKLITDSKSIFYAVDKINKNLLNRARKSLYSKDKVFIKLATSLE